MRGLTISQVLPYKAPVEKSDGEGTKAAQPPVREADQWRGLGGTGLNASP